MIISLCAIPLMANFLSWLKYKEKYTKNKLNYMGYLFNGHSVVISYDLQ